MVMEEEQEKAKGQEGGGIHHHHRHHHGPPALAWPPRPPRGRSPFRKDSHSSCAENVERRLFVFCPWDMLCSKVQEWGNVITDFLWRGSKF